MEKLLAYWQDLRMLFSKSYSRQKKWERGKNLWHKLDDSLPLAIGVKSKDEPRLQQFALMVAAYPQKDKEALCIYLEERIADIRNNFSEHTGGREEEIERALWQIYSDHLEILSKKDNLE